MVAFVVVGLLLYAGILATLVFIGHGLFGNYLRLIRVERTGASSHTSDCR